MVEEHSIPKGIRFSIANASLHFVNANANMPVGLYGHPTYGRRCSLGNRSGRYLFGAIALPVAQYSTTVTNSAIKPENDDTSTTPKLFLAFVNKTIYRLE